VTFTNSNTISGGGNTLTTSGLLGSGDAAADINSNSTTIDGGKITANSVIADVSLNVGSGGSIGGTLGTAGYAAFTAPSASASGKRFHVSSAGFTYADTIVNYGHIYSETIGLQASVASPVITGYNTNTNSNAHAARFSNTTGTYGTSGLVGPANGYDFYAEGTGLYGPFTGGHDSLFSLNYAADMGDILVDDQLISASGLSNTIFSAVLSSTANEAGVLGVLSARVSLLADAGGSPPAAFVVSGPDPLVLTSEWDTHKDDYELVAANGLGEGQVNVVPEGGNISKGDLIVTSSVAGKGMKQSDNIIRSHTVAKARSDVVWAQGDTSVKLVPCIYLCG